jgi:hypothetical protein
MKTQRHPKPADIESMLEEVSFEHFTSVLEANAPSKDSAEIVNPAVEVVVPQQLKYNQGPTPTGSMILDAFDRSVELIKKTPLHYGWLRTRIQTSCNFASQVKGVFGIEPVRKMFGMLHNWQQAHRPLSMHSAFKAELPKEYLAHTAFITFAKLQKQNPEATHSVRVFSPAIGVFFWHLLQAIETRHVTIYLEQSREHGLIVSRWFAGDDYYQRHTNTAQTDIPSVLCGFNPAKDRVAPHLMPRSVLCRAQQ